jgi:hypothetical protein
MGEHCLSFFVAALLGKISFCFELEILVLFNSLKLSLVASVVLSLNSSEAIISFNSLTSQVLPLIRIDRSASKALAFLSLTRNVLFKSAYFIFPGFNGVGFNISIVISSFISSKSAANNAHRQSQMDPCVDLQFGESLLTLMCSPTNGQKF